ncbi:hypothetical protein P171DRAFT_437699 [Karstenula rhodostoma CBS 690.94]|uniref:Uncharacterized protein n=1 Tax=Karstenula rhodostoma CBS 690.94 TaxID=1392251 RepID=A0A9P4P6J7_9PLEO|nr:hypothetical protein P171DRAFT_437699 [Karstenula rhodostoma CBS 690.94]
MSVSTLGYMAHQPNQLRHALMLSANRTRRGTSSRHIHGDRGGRNTCKSRLQQCEMKLFSIEDMPTLPVCACTLENTKTCCRQRTVVTASALVRLRLPIPRAWEPLHATSSHQAPLPTRIFRFNMELARLLTNLANLGHSKRTSFDTHFAS